MIDFFILIEYNIMYNSQLYNTVYVENETVNKKQQKIMLSQEVIQ